MPKIHPDNPYCIEYSREELLVQAEDLARKHYNLSAKEVHEKYKSGEISYCDLNYRLSQCFFLLNDEIR